MRYHTDIHKFLLFTTPQNIYNRACVKRLLKGQKDCGLLRQVNPGELQ